MNTETRYTFTVFTPTFNRAHTLHRVYASLAAQSFRNFEWLIVDDGSVDDTARLVLRWQVEASFPIRYLSQANQGKHVATDRGVAEARGELFLVIDSDDGCVPEALERFAYHWFSIPEHERVHFTGVTALCTDQHGRLVGDPFPRDVLDSDALELRYRHKVRGEKWGFNRTDVVRRFPLPEQPLRTCVPESIVWNRIAREYKTRFINERLRIYWIEGQSLSHGQTAVRSAVGGRLAHRTVLTEEFDWFRYAPLEFLRSAVHYARFSFHLGFGLRTQWRELARWPVRLLWLVMVLPAYLVYATDRR